MFNSKKPVRTQLNMRMVNKYSKNSAANIKFSTEAADIHLARSANLPEGLYILLALIINTL